MAQPWLICTIAMTGQRTGSRVGRRTRSSIAAATDTRDAPRTQPWSQAAAMEQARTVGPLHSVLPWLATKQASCPTRWRRTGEVRRRSTGQTVFPFVELPRMAEPIRAPAYRLKSDSRDVQVQGFSFGTGVALKD